MKIDVNDVRVGHTIVLWQAGVGTIGAVSQEIQYGFYMHSRDGEVQHSLHYLTEFGRNMTLELDELSKI